MNQATVKILKTSGQKEYLIKTSLSAKDYQLAEALNPDTLVLVDKDKKPYFKVAIRNNRATSFANLFRENEAANYSFAVSAKGITLPLPAAKNEVISFHCPVLSDDETAINVIGASIQSNLVAVEAQISAYLVKAKATTLEVIE